jgi:hypothetical protein
MLGSRSRWNASSRRYSARAASGGLLHGHHSENSTGVPGRHDYTQALTACQLKSLWATTAWLDDNQVNLAAKKRGD